MNDDRTTRARRKRNRRVRRLARLVMKTKEKPLPPLPQPPFPQPTEDYLLAEKPVCDVEPLPLEWLWPGRIPLGGLTLIAGDEGVGKSLVALDIAARVTRGSPWPDAPDEPQEEGNVLVLSAYDPLLGTAMPRFLQAGNNLERTFFSDGLDGRFPVSETGLKRRFRLPDDLRRLRRTIDEHNPMRLVVIDPIWAFCGKEGQRDATDPAILAALAKLAAEYEVAIVCVTGMKRATRGRASFQAAGDKGLLAAARAAWGIARHPGKEGQRVLLPIKMNLGPEREGSNSESWTAASTGSGDRRN